MSVFGLIETAKEEQLVTLVTGWTTWESPKRESRHTGLQMVRQTIIYCTFQAHAQLARLPCRQSPQSNGSMIMEIIIIKSHSHAKAI